MVEVYKTDVKKRKQEKIILKKLKQKFPLLNINFDLEDCDNILRVENISGKINNEQIIYLVQANGFFIQVLDDRPTIDSETEVRSETI